MLKNLVETIRTRIEKRRQYQRLIAEIETLNSRDLQDLRADAGQMRYDAWHSIYG